MLVAKEVEIILNFSDCFRRFSRKQKETFKFIKNRQLIIFLFCVVSISIIVGIGSSINTLAVSIDGNQTILKSIDDDMERLANNSGIQWNWHDKVSQSNDGQLYKLNVSTTFSVKLLVDGNEYLKWVTGGTVDDILTEYGIILNSDDGMNYKHGDALFSGMTIDINRVNFKEYTMTEEIPFNTSSLDVVLPQGKKAPDNIAGVNGTKTITRRDTVVDGIVTGSQIISETIDKEPIHAINYVVKIAPEPTPVKNPSFSFDNLINNKTI
ncbi:MAG: G5 domain-containing protein, partial [Clostridia bacterium]